MDDAAVSRFMSLFKGSGHYHITCNTKRAKDKQNVTQRKAYTIEQVKEHLSGGLGLGTSPLLGDNSCVFGAIDIDRTDDVDEVDFAAINARVRAAGLPLMLCRTRSGGAHLYLFLQRPAPAKVIRTLITRYADLLSIKGTDCLLPAVDYQLFDDDGEPHITRSINLPYHGGDETTRYAFASDGKTKLTLQQFLDRAEANRADPGLLANISDDPHAQAPPCVQRLLREGIPVGMRNEALTQIALYLKRVDSKDVLPRLTLINRDALESPVNMDELRKIAKSATRRDYLYRCKTEPCKSLCDSAVCVTREYGISPSERDNNTAADALANLPAIDDIARIQDSEQGGVYRLRINGHSFTAKARDLVQVREAQLLFAERIGIILPAKLNYAVWYDYIMERIRSARIDIQAAEDTDSGQLHAQVVDFVTGRMKAHDDGGDRMQHRARLDVAPILEDSEVIFRMSTFERYCRDKRLSLPSSQMRIAELLRKSGAQSKRLRTPSGVVPVWCLPYRKEEFDQHFDEIKPQDPNNDY